MNMLPVEFRHDRRQKEILDEFIKVRAKTVSAIPLFIRHTVLDTCNHAERAYYLFPARILRRVPPKMFACAPCPTPQVSSIFT